MNIVENSNGDKFSQFNRMPELFLTSPECPKPITCALILATNNSGTLLVFDTWKQKWELPGGAIEKGETPRQCAFREFAEETGVVIPSLQFEGIMKFTLTPDNRTEYGTLFSCSIDEFPTFIPNNEISNIALWNGMDDIGVIDEIDAAIAMFNIKSPQYKAN